MASGDAETRDMDNSNSESEHDSDEDLAVLELIDASSSDDDDDVKEDVRRHPDRRSKPLPESDRATASASSRVDRPLSELVEENSKVKRYPNKTGTFVTGIDVLSKDAKEKRSRRAERFGISKEEQKITSSDGEVEDVAGVVLPPGSKIDGSSVRLEAIHLRGVDDMSTKDIFGYFKNYMPSSIEWVDDTSCNVVWLDQQSAARALAGMSRSQRPQQPSGSAEVQTSKSSQRPADSDEEPMEEDDEEQILDLISNKETGETERIPKSPQSSTLPADTLNTDSMQSRPDSDMSEQAMECLEMVEADMRPVEVKSKDITRIGKPHPKADELFMRFASIDDKKQKGAYKHSQYYLKYGNPNFGGYKGLVSLSKRKQFRDGKFHPASSDRRKRRYGYQEDWDEEEEGENLHPRKRKPDDGESKEQTKDLRERLKKGSAKRHSSGSDGEDGEKEERQNTEREEEEVDEEAETLDAELRHAMGEFSPKRKMQMYADEVEAELKKLREESGTTEPLYKIRDAREGLKQRLSVRDRLGHIRAAPTPASSLENLKIIIDTQDDISEKSSSEEEEEQGEKSSQEKGPLCQSDDLRSWLHNRETSRKLLENLPSLKIEVQDDT